MAKIEESVVGDLEKLALITDGIQNVFPDGVGAIVFELKPHDYYRVKNNFKQLNTKEDRFKIDISGVEVIFILEGSIEFNVVIKKLSSSNCMSVYEFGILVFSSV